MRRFSLDALAREVLKLHAGLPNEIAGDWGYRRRMTAYSGFVVPELDARRHLPVELDWLSDGVVLASRLGTTETTAIVHPRAFTAATDERRAETRRGIAPRACHRHRPALEWIDREGS
jgi:hypothetical protein